MMTIICIALLLCDFILNVTCSENVSMPPIKPSRSITYPSFDNVRYRGSACPPASDMHPAMLRKTQSEWIDKARIIHQLKERNQSDILENFCFFTEMNILEVGFDEEPYNRYQSSIEKLENPDLSNADQEQDFQASIGKLENSDLSEDEQEEYFSPLKNNCAGTENGSLVMNQVVTAVITDSWRIQFLGDSTCCDTDDEFYNDFDSPETVWRWVPSLND